MPKKRKKIRIFSALEVANICGVVNQTAINWIKGKYLKAFTTPGGQYRVYADDLHSFLESRGMRIPDELAEIVAEDARNQKILIVDDDADLNNLLLRYFEKTRPEQAVLQAFDGFEAGRILAEAKPGIVILDINLPGIDGHKLCKKIKSDPSLGNPQVIAITGIPDDTLEATILAEGADAFVTKPFAPDELARRIDALAEED